MTPTAPAGILESGEYPEGPLEGEAKMADKVKKAKEILKRVLKEFGPTKDHAIGAGREILLALRSVVDAEINLLDAATKKKPSGSKKGE